MKNLLKSFKPAIFAPMPLNEFENYDDYWKKRQAPQQTTNVLHRCISIGNQIPNNCSVLDIGCGRGDFLRYLKSLNKNLTLHGADLSSHAITHLKKDGITGSAIDSNLTLQEQISGQFDYIVMMEVIEHVHEAEDLVRQILAFQPKAVFITIPNAGYIIHRFRLMFGGRFPVTFILMHMKEHIRFWTVKDFYQWAGHVGLKCIQHQGQEKGTRSPLRLFLIRNFPSLFAAQVIYKLVVLQPALESKKL